ncbi:MAG: PspC domain-containing protein [Austwickia sp.]|nr:PspC domain-containing protein [Austwickia sp.]MBK9100350.1 PspC domain-containing protein [Austwickia sp.]
MSTAVPSLPAEGTGPPPLRRIVRPRRGRQLVGVAAGLAEHLDLPVARVRWTFAALTLVGVGSVVYLLLWILTPVGEHLRDPEGDPASSPGWASLRTIVVVAGFVTVGLAVALAVNARAFINPSTLLPLAAVAGGAVLAWSHLDQEDATRAMTGAAGPSASRRQSMLRLAVGTTLAAAGIVAVATRDQGLAVLWDVIVAAVAVVVGIVLILTPWGMRFWRRLQLEQARAIRETERADIAAHLHDSVLQTLALIQRTDDPVRVTQLARAQERDLRQWLYGKDAAHEATLAAAVARVAAEVEDLHGVPIEVVVTGDAPSQEPTEALIAALREALLNAVRHGAPPVSAYVEAGPRGIEAFVRDRGQGFDLQDVPPDRLGVRESILGRMTRRGGSATVRRMEPGTEVSLFIPVVGHDPGPSAIHESTEPEPSAVGGTP